MNRKENDIAALLAPVVAMEGCEIWGVEYRAQGKHSKLAVYIDNEEGISVDHCERVSRRVSDVLDVEEVLSSAYTLEVSSPGLDRALTKPAHFQRFTGEDVRIKLRTPVDGRRNFRGALRAADDESIEVEVDGQSHKLDIAAIASARLVPAV